MINIVLIVQLFALLNPLASFPFLMSANRKNMDVKRIAANAVAVAFAVAMIMVLGGEYLFSVFGITIDSLRIAGGIVLLLLGIHMVTPKEEEHKVGRINSLIAIMATPLLTGPATISFVTVKALEMGRSMVIVNTCLAFLIVGAVFVFFSLLINRINERVIDISSRIMGLFLTAVAIEMISKGIEGVIRVAVL